MLVDKNSGGTSLFPRMPRAYFEALRLNFRIDWIDRLLATVRRRTSALTDVMLQIFALGINGRIVCSINKTY